MPSYVRAFDGGVEIDVVVVPRASRTQIVGEHEDRLKIQLNAPPVDGEANAALIRLLAKTFGVKKSAFEIVAGQTSKKKRLRVDGVSLETVLSRLGLGSGGP